MQILDNLKVKNLVLNSFKEDWTGNEPTKTEIVNDYINNYLFEDVPYHFILPRDGSIEIGRDLSFAGEHTIRANGSSIGVLIIASPSNQITKKQKTAIVNLTEKICNGDYGDFPNFEPVSIKRHRDYQLDDNPSVEISNLIPDLRASIDNICNNPNLDDKKKEEEKEKYRIREREGREFYNDFRARLKLQYDAGEIELEDAEEVEDHLEDAIIRIVNGDWLTGKKKIQSKSIQGIFTQALKDEILLGINSYLLENY